MYIPFCEDSKVLFADEFESLVEFKCYEEETDMGNNFIILNKIRNFSIQDLIWDLAKSEIYSSEEQFKPAGYQIISDIDNVDNSLPQIINLQNIEEIEVKSKSSLSILILFSKWKNNDEYKATLDEADADIIIGNAWLKNKRKEEFVFRMIYFKKAF